MALKFQSDNDLRRIGNNSNWRQPIFKKDRGRRFEVGGKRKRLKTRRLRLKSVDRYIFPFEKLEVYQIALDLSDCVLGFFEDLPQNRHIRLIGQMEASSVSPSQNIAEGKGRQYKKEFIRYLHIAQGSINEVITLNEVFRRRRIFHAEQSIEIRDHCENIDRKLNGLVNSLQGKKSSASNFQYNDPQTLSAALLQPPTNKELLC